MRGLLLVLPPVDWVCPNCSVAEWTVGQSNRWHPCSGLAGMLAPLVPAGSGARVLAVEREDYVGGELVAYDDNRRPIAAVVTERPDGSNDVMVNAPAARGGIR